MITAFPTGLELWTLIWPKLLWLLIIMIADVVFGVIEALVHKKFEWQYLMGFVDSDLIPVMAWIVWVVITAIPAGFSQFLPITADALYWIIAVSILGSFLKSLAELGVLTKPFDKVGVKVGEDGAATG